MAEEPAVPEPADGSPPRRRLAGALIVAAGAGAALLVVFGRGDSRPPLQPFDLIHRASVGSRDATSCLACHARDGAVPQPPGHTGRKDCLHCHELGPAPE